MTLDNVLIVVEAIDEKLFLAARNLPHVEVVAVAAVNPLSLARHDKVLMTVGAVKMLEERLHEQETTHYKRAAREQLMNVLLAPHMSEKTARVNAERQPVHVPRAPQTRPRPTSSRPSS